MSAHTPFDDEPSILGASCHPIPQPTLGDFLRAIERQGLQRIAEMPDEQAALNVLFAAWLRLKELGWSEAIYCPKDGSKFHAIEAGSTGVHVCQYDGEWPKGSWWIVTPGDIHPSHPILWRAIAKATQP